MGKNIEEEIFLNKYIIKFENKQGKTQFFNISRMQLQDYSSTFLLNTVIIFYNYDKYYIHFYSFEIMIIWQNCLAFILNIGNSILFKNIFKIKASI